MAPKMNGGPNPDHEINQQFRTLVAKADKKFARVRDLPLYARGPSPAKYLQKVFKAYTKVWKYQQQNRSVLLSTGLQRWEIGEIASRIGQLYFGQYQRTGEARFLLEAFVFYDAIFRRAYFDVEMGNEHGGGGGGGVRFKELRFYARFLLVALILDRRDMVSVLVEKFRVRVDDCKAAFRESNFKEWRLVVQEIVRFVNVDKEFPSTRPLRYCPMFDTHPESLQFVARFHAKKVLKLQDAVLTSYHRNEVKFAELTLDTYRMLQCLEWEPSGTLYQKHQKEHIENGNMNDFSGTSGVIDLHLADDMTDPDLPPNPRKALLYRPTATHLLAVISTVCEELPPESIMLLYVSSSTGTSGSSSSESSSGSRRFSKNKVLLSTSHHQNSSPEVHESKKGYLSGYYDSSICLSPRGIGGTNNLYPGDLLPFTRRPLFLVIDSDNSHAFKVIHGAERGEPSAILMSPSRPSFKSQSSENSAQNGSQFTLFMTAPLLAFCQVVGLTASDRDKDVYDEAENIIANAFAKWEVLMCSSTKINIVWAQVLPDHFLRRLILRFIFCRAVLNQLHSGEAKESYVPECLPQLPVFVSPDSEAVESYIRRLADHLKVSDCFENT